MNYSKKGIENKQNNIKSTSKRLITKTRVALFRLVIVSVVFLAIVGCFAGFGFVKGLVDSAPDISQIDVIPTGFTTTVYDREGNEIEHLIGAHSNRVYVTIDQIPEVIQKAFIAIEDERFYEHDGIDVRGIFRAAFSGLTSGEFGQGASTITQQLLKNQIFEGGMEKTFSERLERKIQEQYLAIQLEDRLDKDTILEYYLNTINLSSGTYGVQTASKRYFNKDVSELTLSEAAVIAAITQYPVYHNPITYPENNAKRRKMILDKMLEFNYCTQEEYDEAIADDVYARIQSINEEMDTTSYYSYFVDELIEQVMKDLQSELGYTENQAANLIYSGGLSIYTTQDSTVQDILDDIYSNEENFPEMGISLWELTYALSIQKDDAKKTTIHYHSNDLLEYYKDFDDPEGLYVDEGSRKFSLLFTDKEDMQKKIDAFRDAMVEEGDTILGEKITMTIQPQSSFVVMDQYTGHVVAIIGGRGEKTGNRTLNRATNTVRQPGSTFKILSTYLPALDTGKFTLASVIDDSGPYYYPGTDNEVNNWTSTKKYEGLSPIRRAIYNSMNIVTVKTLAEVTPQVGYDYLLKLGFTSLVDSRVEEDGRVFSDIKLPMALGGLTDGVSNLELTAAYAAIANGGVYTEPIFYTKVLDHNGKVLLEKKPKTEQVMKESTAFLLTDAMEDVVTKGTGKSYRLTEINMPVAGKTGSTSDYNDLWFSGYTPYYTASIWSGFDNNRPQTERSYQRRLWKIIMEQIHMELNLETKSFTIPDSIVSAKVCSKSGKLAVEGLCDHYLGGNTVYTEYFAKGTEPTEKCDIHVKATICTESKALATENCPLNAQKEAVYINKTETGTTADTPYLLPSGKCKIHKSHGSSIFYDDTIYENDPIYEDEPYYDDDYYQQNNSILPEEYEDQINDFYSNYRNW
ncbi:MAG: PBP1A family penicillin-binding protein [Clostridiales bacterium]|nr:PBP1A family penicillin-binding protein [Clostridiales bacterium]